MTSDGRVATPRSFRDLGDVVAFAHAQRELGDGTLQLLDGRSLPVTPQADGITDVASTASI